MLLNFSIFLAVVVVALGLQKKVTWENAVELGGGLEICGAALPRPFCSCQCYYQLYGFMHTN